MADNKYFQVWPMPETLYTSVIRGAAIVDSPGFPVAPCRGAVVECEEVPPRKCGFDFNRTCRCPCVCLSACPAAPERRRRSAGVAVRAVRRVAFPYLGETGMEMQVRAGRP